MRNNAQGGQNKFLKFISIPLRALAKARDLYVRGMTGCAARSHCSTGSGTTALPLPRSRSSSSNASSSRRRPSDFAAAGVDEDYAELVRAASVRRLGHKNEIDMFLHQQQRSQEIAGLPKSSSVGMARIDEDSACELFGDDEGLNHKNVSDRRLYPRSRSCAVHTRSLF